VSSPAGGIVVTSPEPHATAYSPQTDRRDGEPDLKGAGKGPGLDRVWAANGQQRRSKRLRGRYLDRRRGQKTGSTTGILGATGP
jgi:hypothetical protein